MVDLKHKIAVFGLGYVGLPFTAALAHVGYKVIGVDVNKERIEILKKGEVPFYEPGIKEILEKNKEKIEYTTDSAYALKNSDVIFLTVGTPLDENDEPDYTQIDSCIKEIGKGLKKDDLIILKSTVVVGTTEERVAPKLEEISGMKAGEDFHLVFCPERTIEGLALHEIYNLPKIIGGINKESSLHAQKILKKLGSRTNIVSSPKVAEMCKLVDNLYRSNNIAFANELAELCEKIGIRSSEVVSTVNDSYPRTKIFNPGLGADGPCLSKDPIIFRHSAIKHKVKTPVTDGSIIQNKLSTSRIAEMIKHHILKNNLEKINLSIIGLAFKGFPETDDLRGSPAMKILDILEKDNIRLDSIKLFDPLVKKFRDYQLSNSISEAIENANIILFLTNHPKIMNLEFEHLLEKTKNPVFIIDAWGNINYDEIPKGVHYFRIGHGYN
ncbi:MAG: nucleotide sugar dehydrogenase [Nanoarchaeota archaeon]